MIAYRKKYVVLFIALVSILLVLWQVFIYFRQSTLTLQISEGESIAVLKVTETGSKDVFTIAETGIFERRVAPGVYIVSGNKDNAYTKKTIDLKPSATSSVRLDYESTISQLLPLQGDPTVALAKRDPLVRLDSNGRLLNDEKVVYSTRSVGLSASSAAISGTTLLFSTANGKSYLRDTANTYELFASSVVDRDEVVAPSLVNTKISRVALNEGTGEFCAVSDKGEVFSIQKNRTTQQVGNSGALGQILCHNQTFVGIDYGFSADGFSKKRPEGVLEIVRAGEKNLIKKLKNLNGVVLLDESTLVYTAGNSVYSYDISNDSTAILMDIASGDTAYMFNGNEKNNLLLYDNNQLWRINYVEKTANRIAFSGEAKSINFGAQLQTGDVYLSVNRGTATGNYLVTRNTTLAQSYARLRNILPKTAPNFVVDAYIRGDKLVIDVVITAPVGSSGSRVLYNLAVAEAKQYIATLKLDKNTTRVIYR